MPAFHLSLPVADLDAAAAFYADVLGCRRGRTGPDWADLDFFGHQLSLHLVEGYVPDAGTCLVDGTAVPVRHHGVVLDPATWRDLAEDIEDFLLTPRSRFEGAEGESDPSVLARKMTEDPSSTEGSQLTFFVTDPSGNAIEVKAFPEGVWR